MRPKKGRNPNASKSPLLPKPSNPEFMAFANKALGNEVREPLSMRELEKIAREIEAAKPSLARTRELYERHSGVYSRVFQGVLLFKEREFEAVQKLAGINPSDRIAAVGSGNAVLEAFIAKKLAPQGHVSCVDIAHKASKLAKTVTARAGVKNLSVITGSATHLPFKNSTQDKVFSMHSNITQTPFFPSFLKEAWRVLKKTPSSRLVIVQPATIEEEFDWKQELAEHNFSTVSKGQYFVSKGPYTYRVLLLFARPASPLEKIGK